MDINRSEVLRYLADLLERDKNTIIDVNQSDISTAKGEDPALIDRLKVDGKKVDEMKMALLNTAKQEDPDGQVLYEYTNTEGLFFRNITVPFGTILIIYESRPDVTIEAAAMAFKSGNKIILKGGKEATNTNLYLVKLWKEALSKFGYDDQLVKYLDFSRTEIQHFISSKNESLDLIIPRGGDALIQFVLQHAVAPVIVSGRGNNFVYVHTTADKQMAVNVIANGKSRISVCNATDKVLIDKNIADLNGFVYSIMETLLQLGIQVYGDKSLSGFSEKLMIDEEETVMYEEFLSPKILLILTENVDDAILKINKYSGGHSASIITSDNETAQKFMKATDCAAVYHNASTRFTDGGQVGFGGEMAISTQKLHFRGPVGMAQLVTNKWMIYGNGHIR